MTVSIVTEIKNGFIIKKICTDTYGNGDDEGFLRDHETLNAMWDAVKPGRYFLNRAHKKFLGGAYPFFMGTYAEFLQTKEWKETRKDIMEIFGPKCYICQKRKARHVHHQTYEFGWLPETCDWPPPLIPVCLSCHHKQHS